MMEVEEQMKQTKHTSSVHANKNGRTMGPRARARMRQRRRRRRILAFLGICILVLACVAGVLLLRDHSVSGLPKAFSILAEFPSRQQQSGIKLAESFAQNLCVSDSNNVEYEGISLPEGQQGALFNVEDRTVMYAQGLYDRVYPASITKIMTAIVAYKYGDMSATVTVSENALDLEAGSQVCGLQVGDQLTLEELLDCLLVYSGNDAAAAIAEQVGGSISGFVDLMNQEAQALGCTGTHFTNPHGLQDENHYTTPYDIYLMLREALNYTSFLNTIQLSSYTATPLHADGTEGSIFLESTDLYLTGAATPPKSVTILGGKTGTTSLAGNCLALLAQNEYGKPYVAIVMGASTKDLLYQQMNTLLEKIND